MWWCSSSKEDVWSGGGEKGGDNQDLRVNQDGCRQHLIENRLWPEGGGGTRL